MTRTVVIVDDHADFRARATDLLAAAGWDVVGSCPDGHSGLAAIATHHPDVVLLDVQLPDIDGFAVLAQIDPIPGLCVVLISSREEADYGTQVARSGAIGFITKAELSARSLSRLLQVP